MRCAKLRIKLNPEKTKVIILSRSILARKTEPNLKLYGERLKAYPQVKFLGITFDSHLTFKKHFEDILDCCNTRYHRLRLLANKKWEPSPSTLIPIYKQCVRPIFEYGSLSSSIISDYIISKIQWLQTSLSAKTNLCLPNSHGLGQICTPHLLIILTKPACHHNSFWESRCDSNHAPTISLKPVLFHGDFGNSFWHTTHFSSKHTASLLVTIYDISSYFGHVS